MMLQRLLRMGFPEIACRGRQEVSKWLERIGMNGNRNGGAEAIFKKTIPDPALLEVQSRAQDSDISGAARILLSRFQETSPGRFFEGVESDRIPPIVSKQMPEFYVEILAMAEAIRQGRFNLLGYRNLSFGDPIDWHLDPVSGRRSPFVHWSRIDPLDAGVVGDSKVIWELNRQQWLVHLGLAYKLTGDERYAETFAGYFRQWIQENPPGKGINWASSLEVALRLISWCWALLLFRVSKALSPELFVKMLEGIRTHAVHVEKYLSYYFAPNTHLTGEALGLFYAGVLFPELRPASRWRELGARILVEESDRQILDDGVYFEQSTCYQRYTAEIYLHFLILAERNGIDIPPKLNDRVQKMLDFLLAVCRPDGSMPQIGDADGGWLLPIVPRAPDDFRGIFSVAAALFGRSDYGWAAGGAAPEALWLLGEKALETFEVLDRIPPTTSSRVFPEGGYVVMRSGWEEEAHQLVFDVGPLGCPISSGHGHADLLSVQCSAFGESYLVDPGTYCYTADLDWRNFFRSAAAHSSVIVDGMPQAVPAGPFAWKERPGARLRRWISNELYDLADGEHYAYRSLSDPVTHRRRVIFVKPRYWVIVDDLEGTAEHRLDLRFQFAPMRVALEEKLWARAYGSKGRGLLVGAFATVPLRGEILEGESSPIQGWVSLDYGQRLPAPVLVYSTTKRLPVRIVTLLLPTACLSSPPPDVVPLRGYDGQPIGLVFRDWHESVIVREREIVLRQTS